MKRIACTVAGAALLLAPGTASAQEVTATQPDPSAIAEGARVWSANCTRCHAPRPASERTDRQWLTIVAHMRARANLTRSDAAAVATFLRATNAAQAAAPATPVGDADANGTDAAETDGEAVADTLRRQDVTRRVLSALVLDETQLTVAERNAILAYLRALRPPE